MASITIRNLDDETTGRLKERASHRGRSIEDEALAVLREALASQSVTPQDLAASIAARFKPLGGIDLKLPPRGPMREPLGLSG